MSKDFNKKLFVGAGAAALSFAGVWWLKNNLPLSPKIPVVDDNTVLLFQFPYSPFCIKVAKIMDYKGIPYKAINLVPFLHKNFIKSMSGQGLVPTIKHKGRIISDSTFIAKYLEELKPEPSLFFSNDEKLNKDVLMLEDWADEAFVQPFSKLAYIYLFEHPEVIIESNEFDTGLPIVDNNKSKIVPLLINFRLKDMGIDINQKDILKKRARASLEILLSKLEKSEFLVGDKLSLADITVASHLSVAEKVPYIAEDDIYEPIFEWQKKIFNQVRRRTASSLS